MMNWLSCSILLCLFVVSGCAHSRDAASLSEQPAASPRHEAGADVSSPEHTPMNPAAAPATPGGGGGDGRGKAVKEGTATATASDTAAPVGGTAKAGSASADYADYVEEADDRQEGRSIADPLEPFNRAMYHFNDKLYFWVLKPVAQGYKAIVPEVARIGVNNFFTNIAFPVRFVNCLLQANFGGATLEVGRFVLNTLGGIGGFLDPASHPEVNLVRQDEDFGQTLGVYGVGQGFFINWPVLGPSSPRDSLGTVGDYFLHPFSYYDGPWLVPWGVRAYERVNDTSLRIGDYESLKEAAIDPYVAIRDAYVQYRLNKVKEKGKERSP